MPLIPRPYVELMPAIRARLPPTSPHLEVPLEDADLRDLGKLFDLHRRIGKRGWYHGANERVRERGRRRAAALGTKSGWPDIIIIEPVILEGVWHSGVAIELKRAKPESSVVSPEQEHWIKSFQHRGWIAEVCYGFAEAAALVRHCYG